MTQTLPELAAEVEAALSLEAILAEKIMAALGEACGRKVKRPELDSTDAVLALIFALRPGWDIAIHGTANLPNGHWSCTLRSSGVRDNDPYLGVGRGPTLPHALLAALLKVLSYS